MIFFSKLTKQFFNQQELNHMLKEYDLINLSSSTSAPLHPLVEDCVPVKVNYELSTSDPNLLPYQSFDSIDDIRHLNPSDLKYNSDTNEYTYTIKSKTSELLLEESWFKVRQQRDRLLAKYDWIEADSDVVTNKCKLQVKAYKRLLRQLPSLFEYPHQVVFPVEPCIEIKQSRKTKGSRYPSSTEVETLLATVPDALEYWIKCRQPLDRKIVQDILDTYTP